MRHYADLGIEEVHVMASSGNPAAFIDGLAQNVTPFSPTCDDPSYRVIQVVQVHPAAVSALPMAYGSASPSARCGR